MQKPPPNSTRMTRPMGSGDSQKLGPRRESRLLSGAQQTFGSQQNQDRSSSGIRSVPFATLFQSLSEKNGFGWFPAKRPIERLSTMPNTGDHNPLPSIAESFLNRKNQTGSDALMPD